MACPKIANPPSPDCVNFASRSSRATHEVMEHGMPSYKKSGAVEVAFCTKELHRIVRPSKGCNGSAFSMISGTILQRRKCPRTRPARERPRRQEDAHSGDSASMELTSSPNALPGEAVIGLPLIARRALPNTRLARSRHGLQPPASSNCRRFSVARISGTLPEPDLRRLETGTRMAVVCGIARRRASPGWQRA
jgi:hypothetical protein